MALQNTDLFLVERGGVQYQMTANQIADFVGAVRDETVADITARDALTAADIKAGDRVFVTDASADATVDTGWAIYRVVSTGPNVFEKIQEQESMDVMVNTNVNLSVTRTAASITIGNDAGDDAVLPAVDGTNAGLATPDMFNNSHPAAAAGLTAATNPVVVNPGTQQITFNITQLTALP